MAYEYEYSSSPTAGIDESNCLELMDDNVHLNSEGQDMYVELIHDALKREKE